MLAENNGGSDGPHAESLLQGTRRRRSHTTVRLITLSGHREREVSTDLLAPFGCPPPPPRRRPSPPCQSHPGNPSPWKQSKATTGAGERNPFRVASSQESSPLLQWRCRKEEEEEEEAAPQLGFLNLFSPSARCFPFPPLSL